MNTLIEAQYFPPLEYFSFLKSKNEIWIETKERFEKQTYRNRCYILSANKVLPLTVPVKFAGKKPSMDQVEIDYKEKWLNQHWRAIISAYNKSPFFEYYQPEIEAILFARHDQLLTLNLELLTFCLKALNIDTKIRLTEKYENGSESPIEDMRSVIHPKKDYICNEFYSPIPYHQIFGDKFVANLSVLDLISCVGPESSSYF